jgi:protein SCO1/2
MFSLSPTTALLTLMLALNLGACQDRAAAHGDTLAEGASGEEQQANRYTVNGVVRGIDRDRLSVTIAHEDVPGYMPAMTMPFELRSADQVDGLDVGDEVRFTFQPESGGRHVVVEIAKR